MATTLISGVKANDFKPWRRVLNTCQCAVLGDLILVTSVTSGKLYPHGRKKNERCNWQLHKREEKKGLWKRTADLNPSRQKPTEGGIEHIKHQSYSATAAVSESATYMRHSLLVFWVFVQRSQWSCQLRGTLAATFFPPFMSMCVTYSISPLFNQLVSNDYPQQQKRASRKERHV